MQKPLVIMPGNKKLCQFDEDMLSRLRNGNRYTTSDWSKILDLLVIAKARREHTCHGVGRPPGCKTRRDIPLGLRCRASELSR